MPSRCHVLIVIATLAAVCVAGGMAVAASVPSLKITILYDNTVGNTACRADWGFACLVEGPEKTILWDTGAKADIFAANTAALNTDFSRIGAIAISHAHGDHTAGLVPAVRKIKGIPVFLPPSSPQALVDAVGQAGGVVRIPKEPVEICADVLLTGDLGGQIPEQALLVRTTRGLVVVTGCSHPGIVSMLERARSIGKQNPYAVIGGFHLLQQPEASVREIVSRFKALGVSRVAATHCTGPEAIALFRDAYGAAFIEAGAGRVIEIQ